MQQYLFVVSLSVHLLYIYFCYSRLFAVIFKFEMEAMIAGIAIGLLDGSSIVPSSLLFWRLIFFA